MTVSLRQAPAGDSSGSPAAFRAPLFHHLLDNVDETDRYVVLDLGAASTAMLALLGQCRCHVENADLAHFGGIDRLNAAECGPPLAAVAESLLPNRQINDAVDIVYCWDLLNYLSADAIAALMDTVARRGRRGTLAHALICYAEPEMSAHPGRFVPAPDDGLVDQNAAVEWIAAPRYTPDDLAKMMGPFVIDRARLLANGMQEFLFRLET